VPILQIEPLSSFFLSSPSSLEPRPPPSELAHVLLGPVARVAVDDRCSGVGRSRGGESERERESKASSSLFALSAFPPAPLPVALPRLGGILDDHGDSGLHEPGDEVVVGERGSVDDGDSGAETATSKTRSISFVFRSALLFFFFFFFLFYVTVFFFRLCCCASEDELVQGVDRAVEEAVIVIVVFKKERSRSRLRKTQARTTLAVKLHQIENTLSHRSASPAGSVPLCVQLACTA